MARVADPRQRGENNNVSGTDYNQPLLLSLWWLYVQNLFPETTFQLLPE